MGLAATDELTPLVLRLGPRRLTGDAEAWQAAAVATDHPVERRALYALLGRAPHIAKALVPSLRATASAPQVDEAGAFLFGAAWPTLRQAFGLPRPSLGERVVGLFAKAVDPVAEFERARVADRLAWAAAHLPDPEARETAMAALEETVRK